LNSSSRDPDTPTPESRLDAVAALFAKAILRRRAHRLAKEPKSQDSAAHGLDVSPETVLSEASG